MTDGTRKVELLAPAGNLEKLATVLRFGADAVYLGGHDLNLRSQADNFTPDELGEAVRLTHDAGRLVYVTLNILAHNSDLDRFPEVIRHLDTLGVDAVIVADLGVLDLVQQNSSLSVHISTQTSSTNWRAVAKWRDLGASRVILARELSLDEISEIRQKVPDCELEVFVHGAMCMAYSGRCHLSSYLAGRDGNRGLCTNTCRWKYTLMEEKRPGQYFPVIEDDNGVHIFNSKDLCTIDFLDRIIATGVDGLKIEGRMKGLLYGATVTKLYRQALDSCLVGDFHQDPSWAGELATFAHRGYTSGFYYGELDKDFARYAQSGYDRSHELAGKVIKDLGDGSYILEIRNRVESGREVEFISPDLPPQKCVMPRMERLDDGEILDLAHARQELRVRLPFQVGPGDLFRQLLKPAF